MKGFRIIGHFYFGALIILAVLFYKERIIYCDAANFIFKIINSGTFNFEAHRYGIALTQILPIIAIKLNLSLRTILLLYSVSFILVYYLLFIICSYFLKNIGAGILITLILSLGIYHAFVHDVTETNMALVFIAVFYAWLNYSWNEKNIIQKIMKYLGCFLFVILCYFTHPVSIFPILFIIGYYIVDKNEWKNYILYIVVIATVCLFIFKFLSIDLNSYEGSQIGGLTNFFNVIHNFFHLYSLKYFILKLRGIYFFTIFLFAIVTINYLYQRQILKLTFFLFATLSFFSILIINFYNGDSDMMMEKNFMPLTIFIGIPFVNDFLMKKHKLEYLKKILLIIILCFGLNLMFSSGLFYSNRIKYLNELLVSTKQKPNNKIIIDNSAIASDKIIISWGLSIETLLYSSLISPNESKTIFAVDLNTMNPDILNTDQFLYTSFWPILNITELNKTYFHVGAGKYTLIDKK
jgi:hypothetical protein